MLDFDKMNSETIKNFKGGDGEVIAKMFFDGKVRIMKAVLKPGCSIGKHTHETNSEVIYCLSGKGDIIVDGEPELLEEGKVHYCKKGSTHELKNNYASDLVIFAIVPEQ